MKNGKRDDISNDTVSFDLSNATNNVWVASTSSGIVSTGIDLSDEIYNKILARLSARPIIEYKCHNCGAPVEIEESKHIFHCQYCGSVYAIGTTMINDFE